MTLGEFKELRNIMSNRELLSQDDFLDLMEAGEISPALEKRYGQFGGWDRLVDQYAECMVVFADKI